MCLGLLPEGKDRFRLQYGQQTGEEVGFNLHSFDGLSLDLQRNLFLEVPCGPQVVVRALVRVFQLLDLELGSLEGLEGLAERHILHILPEFLERLDKEK